MIFYNKYIQELNNIFGINIVLVINWTGRFSGRLKKGFLRNSLHGRVLLASHVFDLMLYP